ncbi:hypothetical protein SACN33_26690 (plasmid) [Staphylococcus aureus]
MLVIAVHKQEKIKIIIKGIKFIITPHKCKKYLTFMSVNIFDTNVKYFLHYNIF